MEPININGLLGLQSFAYGQHGGKWLIIGGRLDGLHRRQPWATFDIAGHNTQLIVVDPIQQKKWSAPMTSLSTGMQEQLSSTNMNFYQEGAYLYCLGGYGYSGTIANHTTFSNLTAIHVEDVINAIVNGTTFSASFRQITDAKFQVTGGKLKKINDTYYLMGGQKFLGRYNPMNNPSFTQAYTNQVRRFKLQDNGTQISITHLAPWTSAQHLHRRDYNAEPQIMTNGQDGLTMFSGVFQPQNDLPFLNPVNIDSQQFEIDSSFRQYYNHYHCAAIPLYAASMNEMHTIFFGGMAQYFDSSGVLVQDNNVPFVNTIARVTRDKNGKMTEYKLPIEMPTLLGAGSEFFPNQNLAQYPNGVLKLDEFPSDSTHIGYVFGGISSTAANIFWINNGTQSQASNQIFKVTLIKNKTSAIHQVNPFSTSSLHFSIQPNPSSRLFQMNYHLKERSNVKITIPTLPHLG
jgi:hypothetical protein